MMYKFLDMEFLNQLNIGLEKIHMGDNGEKKDFLEFRCMEII